MTDRPGEVLLVRHGEREWPAEKLTEMGRIQMFKAGSEIMSRNFTGKSLVLSSAAPFAVEGAEIIAGGLNGAEVVPSRLVEKGSKRPELVKDLDRLLAAVMRRSMKRPEPGGALVDVMHKALIATVVGIEDPDYVDHGSVHKYPIGSWVSNPNFDLERAKAEWRLIGNQP